MFLFGLYFVLYFFKLSGTNGFWNNIYKFYSKFIIAERPVSYQCWARAENEVLFLLSLVPSSPPTNVQGFTISTTSVAVYWDDVPWGTSHGIIIGYICYYRRMNDGPPADELVLEE